MKKFLSLLLAALLVCALIPASVAEGEDIHVSILCSTWSPYDPEETSVWDELYARTGIRIDWQWAPSADFDSKVNTTLAGADIPDVIYTSNPSLLINQEAAIPLDDYLAELAPNYLARLNPEDYIYLRNVGDGKMYFVSHILDFPPSMSNLIRADWVAKAGMEMPKTWADFMAYWEWVRDNDANGNGDTTDEMPLVQSGTSYLLDLAQWFDIKINNPYFATTDDGELVSLYEHEHFNDFLTTMVELYKNGILDKEFITRGDTFKTVLNSGLGGSTFYWAEYANIVTATMRETDPEATFCFVEPPRFYADAPGRVYARGKMYTYGSCLTTECEDAGHVENVMALFNYIYSEEGSNLMNYGVEGVHHTVVDGKFVLNDEILSGGFAAARKAGIIPSIFSYNFQADAYMQILTQNKSYDEMAESFQLFYDALMDNEPYFYAKVPKFTTESYVENGAELEGKITSAFAQCVVGDLTIDEFYAQYEAIKAAGWQDIIDEQIEAYEAVK
jgi:putative aldouronate transport system substrate-binding protein